MIEIKDLVKTFENKEVISSLDLKIEDGKIFGLIGPNGAGKSTLLNLLTGSYQKDSGSILYDGKEVYENIDVKKEIFFLSDDPYYFPHATIDTMKDFYKQWYDKFDEECYKRLMNIFKLPQKKQMKDFSKGMKRQAMLAIALAIKPQYLFLDEAFDGLDPMMRLIFKKEIIASIEDNHMTMIISSHNLRELEDICDSFGILEGGRISTSGDLYETKESIHKIQLAFKEEMNEEDFTSLDILSFNKQSRVINMVVRGDIEVIDEYLNTLHPLMKEVLPVNLEEIFLYEMERKGYGLYE